MPKPAVIFVIFLLQASVPKAFFGQNFNPRYNFKQLNTQNGLAQNVVYHFLHDSHGYVWLGTRNGLTRFDGARTVNFRNIANDAKSISNNFITRILEDSNQQVWIGNGNGIDLYNRRDNNFTHFAMAMPDGQTRDAFTVPLGFTKAHELWLIETESKSIRIFNTLTRTSEILTHTDAVDGVLWVDKATRSVHIWTYLSVGTRHYIFRDHQLIRQEQFFSKNEDAPKAEFFQIFHVFPENDTSVWLSTTAGLCALNPKTGRHSLYNMYGSEPVVQVRHATLSPQGLLWIGTGGSGIYTFDMKSRKFVDHFKSSQLDPFSICSDNMVSLYFDHSGNIWCGSYGNGVSYTNVGTNFFSKFLSKDETAKWKVNNAIQWIGSDQYRNIWCILKDVQGLWLLDTSLNIQEHRQPALPGGLTFVGSIYQLLFDSNHTAWCMTDRGLYNYNTTTNQMRQLPYRRLSEQLFGSYWTVNMIRLHDGSLLFSTFAGLYRMHREKRNWIIEPFSELNRLPFISFDFIYEDRRKNIYVRDKSSNLYVLAPSDTQMRYRLSNTIDLQYDVGQFVEDSARNIIYVSTNNGLFTIELPDWKLREYPIGRSMAFSNISGMFINKNKLWISGDNGLYCYDTIRKEGRRYTVEDGLPADEFIQSALLQTPAGKFIAGTTNGLVSFDPGKQEDTIYPPLAQLVKIYINDTPATRVANPQEVSSINLSYRQNTFSFDFSPIAYQHALECSFAYKLDNYDENWIRTKERFTRYSKIPPGKYVFRLRVIETNGTVSPFETSLALNISKAFWQTVWFRIAVVLALVFIGWILVKAYLANRIRQHRVEFEKQQAIEKERTRIATDMHDDLGAGLSRIKFLSETIGLKKQQNQSVAEDIASIRKYSNEMISKMGEIVWALNEKNDSLSDLLAYTRAYAAEYLTQSGLRCNFSSPDIFPTSFVSGEFRRNVYLAVKEALHNIVKHSQAGSVDITMKINHKLEIIIHDDGIGYDPFNMRPFANGLTNMERRMKEIGGSFSIRKDNGTTVILAAPIPS